MRLGASLIALNALVALAAKIAGLGGMAGGLLLLAGCILLLLESVYRHARRKAAKRD